MSSQLDEPSCDPRALSEDEVRTHTLLCGDEEITGGHGGRGDWILENNRIRLVLRDVGSSLARQEGTGGGIIDLALVDLSSPPDTLGDSVLEVLPYKDGVIQSVVNITPFEDSKISGFTLTLASNTEVSLWLEPNEAALHIDGSSDWIWRPKPDAEVYGQQLHPRRKNPKWNGVLQWTAKDVVDLGGDIVLSKWTRLDLTNHSADWLSEIEIERSTLHDVAEWMDCFTENNDWIGRIWLDDSEQISFPPSTVFIRLGAEGCLDSEPRHVDTIDADMNDWTLGTCGSVGIQLLMNGSTTDGVWITNDRSIYIPKEGLIHPLHDLGQSSTIWAGLTAEPLELPPLSSTYLATNPRITLDVSETMSVQTQSSLHFRTDAPPFMSQRSVSEPLWESVGLGAEHIRLLGQDVVPPIQDHIPLALPLPTDNVQTGLLSNEEIVSWPWTSADQGAFGALDSTLSMVDLVTQATGRQRLSGITNALYDELSTSLWNAPDFIWLPNPTLATLQSQCDFRQSLPLGPWTWFDSTLNESTPERALLDRSYSTGNGPSLTLSSRLHSDRLVSVELTIESSHWMGLEHWELWSEDGMEDDGLLEQPSFTNNILVPQRDHYCLLVWGTPTAHPFEDSNTWGLRVWHPTD